jgi:polyphosphate kinase
MSDLSLPELFINRELSWLEFNGRVLLQGLSDSLPLLERLKFLAIVSSNLDEALMIRVAGLMQQRAAKRRRCDPCGMTPTQQLAAFSQRAHQLVGAQSAGIHEALAELGEQGLQVLGPREWTAAQRNRLQTYFSREVLPILTPLAVEQLEPCPLLPGLRIHLAAVLEDSASEDAGTSEENGRESPPSGEKIVVVAVPAGFSRFVELRGDSADDNCVYLARLEDVIAANLAEVFPQSKILATSMFRITRDGDVDIDDDEAGDLLQNVEDAILSRRRRAAVRLEISAGADSRIKSWLFAHLDIHADDVYEIDGMIDATALFQLAAWPGFEHLKIPDWAPQPPAGLLGSDDIWQTITDHDVLLYHPYESFDPVIQLIDAAADDPDVLCIKQTLYRTSGGSPIIDALERAAESGKEVTVLLELKARFDESRNVNWARRLEDAGCHVIYGIAGYKTHAKAVLIVRREGRRIRRYVHLATGNYNDKTARLYSDLGLLTADNDLATDVAAFFNLITGNSEIVSWSKLSIAPTGLRQRFLDMIDREIQAATPEAPGLIMAKMNSLEDPEIIQALYLASQAGVKIRLNIRGICCLRPGVKGVSSNIEVCSIIDRYLEHPRIFYFRNGGHEEVYLSSADWMRRNLSKRLEILFPVTSDSPRRRIIEILQVCFNDNTNSHRLLTDGTYKKISAKGKRKQVRAQETFYNAAVEAVRAAEQSPQQFRPLTKPKD